MAHLHHSNSSLHVWLAAHPLLDQALHRGVVWVLIAGLAAMLAGGYVLSFGESGAVPFEIAEPVHVSDQDLPPAIAIVPAQDYFPAQFYAQQLAAREEALPEQF